MNKSKIIFILIILYIFIFPLTSSFSYTTSKIDVRDIPLSSLKHQFFFPIKRLYLDKYAYDKEDDNFWTLAPRTLNTTTDLTPSDLSGLTDMSDLPFVTMDNDDSLDLDQAFYVEENSDGSFYLYYAIADASYFLEKNPILEKRLKDLIYTTYLFLENIPLLGRNTSEDLCSLVEGKLRRALIAKIHINSNFSPLKLKDVEFFHGVIQSVAKLSYRSVQEYFNFLEWDQYNGQWDGRESIPEVKKNLLTFKKMALKIKESGIYPTSQIKTIDPRIHYKDGFITISEGITYPVEELNAIMSVTANNAAGVFIKAYKGIDSSIHRYHQNLKSTAIYSVENTGHAALQLKEYDQFTAPMRRYTDIINHRVILSIIKNNPSLMPDSKKIKEIVNRANVMQTFQKEVEAVQFQILGNLLLRKKTNEYYFFKAKTKRDKQNNLIIDKNLSPILSYIFRPRSIDLKKLDQKFEIKNNDILLMLAPSIRLSPYQANYQIKEILPIP